MEPREDLIHPDEAITLHGLFQVRLRRSAAQFAYQQFDRITGEWQQLSWRQCGHKVAHWQSLLLAEGLTQGDRVALSLRNSWDWIAFEQAALGLGLVVIPLYTDDNVENIAYILQDAAVRCLLLQDAARWLRIQPALPTNHLLQTVFLQEGDGPAETTMAPRISPLMHHLSGATPPLINTPIDPNCLATIVYTSGTTGRPKGVMLSHHNILWVAHSALTMVSIHTCDHFLSFLPLSHTLERTAGYYLPMMAGSAVTFARSIPQLADDLIRHAPTIMIVVPRIFERIYARIQQQLQQGTLLRRLLFQQAVKSGWHHFERSQGRASWHPRLLLHPLLQRLVGNQVTAKLGGKLRLTVSGGAPLSGEIARVFIGLGIPILQGYGLTETSPVISVNTPEDNAPASVGIPLPGIEIMIGARDELLVKSPGVMLGYWNNHAATAQMIDHKGWLHTGDQVRIKDRHIYITGRIKDILVLSNGEKVPPADMELAITMDHLFSQVMVIGEGHPFLAALLVLNAEMWPAFAQQHGLDPLKPESLQHRQLIQSVMERIRRSLRGFPAYAKIRRVNLTLEPWTINNNLMTPSMKLKRHKVLDCFATAIQQIYRP